MRKNDVSLRLSRYPEFSILNDKGISEAINSGHIVIFPSLTNDQLQPGSLDGRIGDVYLYDEEVRKEYYALQEKARNAKELLEVGELTRKYAKYYPNTKDLPITIPPGSFAEICIHESISFDRKEFFLTHELRSGRGRIALNPISILLDYENNEHSVGVHNINKNPIIIYGQDKFTNIFFNLQRDSPYSHGHTVHNPEIVAKLFPEFEKQHLIAEEGYLLFRLGRDILTFKKDVIIDTRNPGDIYEKHDLSKSYKLEMHAPSIVSLTPEVRLPANIGLLLLHNIPFHQQSIKEHPLITTDLHQANAGWVDQGYNGSLTAHPIRNANSAYLEEGMIFCCAQVYLFDSDSNRSYGDKSLGSHYQNSKGASHSKS